MEDVVDDTLAKGSIEGLPKVSNGTHDSWRS
jgi:hypothetical protein